MFDIEMSFRLVFAENYFFVNIMIEIEVLSVAVLSVLVFLYIGSFLGNFLQVLQVHLDVPK